MLRDSKIILVVVCWLLFLIAVWGGVLHYRTEKFKVMERMYSECLKMRPDSDCSVTTQ